MSRNFIIVKAFGFNFPHIKKTPAMSVGHILSMPSPVWNIIRSCVLCNFSLCVAVAEKKQCVCRFDTCFSCTSSNEKLALCCEDECLGLLKGMFCLHRVCAICRDHLCPQIGMSGFSLVLTYCVASAFLSLLNAQS